MSAEYSCEIAALSDVGTTRDHNEDSAGTLIESATCGIAAVADGVSGARAGEEASRIAVERLFSSWREQGPLVPTQKRLVRAAQAANIEVHEKSLMVPELAGMTTTLTAVAIDQGELFCAHVGDSRLYLVREGAATQLTKDHAEGRVLTRSVGRDLICSIDRISLRLQQHDVLVVCSDGLHGVLSDDEIAKTLAGDAERACSRLISAANARGTYDNLSAAVVRMLGPIPARAKPRGLIGLLTKSSAF